MMSASIIVQSRLARVDFPVPGGPTRSNKVAEGGSALGRPSSGIASPAHGIIPGREHVTAGTLLRSGALLSRTITVLKLSADTNIDLEGRAWLL